MSGLFAAMHALAGTGCYLKVEMVQSLYHSLFHPVSTYAVRDECLERTDNCTDSTDCIDTREGFLCRCLPGFMQTNSLVSCDGERGGGGGGGGGGSCTKHVSQWRIQRGV